MLKKISFIFSIVLLVLISTAPIVSAGLASAPQNLTATASNLKITLTWDLPTSNGGEIITDYIIEYSSDGGYTYARVIDAVSTARSAEVGTLINGTTYLFRVATVTNTSGQGPFTTPIGGTPVSDHAPANLPKYSACPTGSIPTAGFTDTSLTHVDCIKYYGITKGVTETTYAPLDFVTRWQMALFLTRMVDATGTALPSGAAQGFSDISNYSSEIQTAINQLKELGITVGKTATTYAPADFVTREEMALFVTRLLKQAVAGPGGSLAYITGTGGAKEIKSTDTDENFTDVPYASMTMESKNAIANLWNLGVTDVQSASLYDPTANINRRAMATFMANALSHTNARPEGLIFQASTYRSSGSPMVYFSITHRDANLNPVSGTTIDTFRYDHVVSTTITRFDTNGNCSTSVLTTSISNIKCYMESADPKTNAEGNLAEFWEIMPTMKKVDFWAWTAALSTYYDNDIHSATAKKITIETHA